VIDQIDLSLIVEQWSDYTNYLKMNRPLILVCTKLLVWPFGEIISSLHS